MKHVPIAAFADKVSHYVAEAAAGEEIVITKHGKEAARLVPPAQDRAALRKAAVAKMLQFRASIAGKYPPVTPEKLRQWLEESRP